MNHVEIVLRRAVVAAKAALSLEYRDQSGRVKSKRKTDIVSESRLLDEYSRLLVDLSWPSNNTSEFNAKMELFRLAKTEKKD